MKVLLDTCTFLWLALDPERLSPTGCQILNDAANQPYLSEVSVLEIVLKYSTGKLPLPEKPSDWIPSRRNFFALKSIALSESAIFRSGELPQLHSDPFNRLLAGQAIEFGMTLLSPDNQLSRLGAARLW